MTTVSSTKEVLYLLLLNWLRERLCEQREVTKRHPKAAKGKHSGWSLRHWAKLPGRGGQDLKVSWLRELPYRPLSHPEGSRVTVLTW